MNIPERYRELCEQGNTPRKAWEQLKKEYKEYIAQCDPEKDAEQSWKSVSGNAFENIVLQMFTTQLGDLQSLKVVQWKSLPEQLKEPLSERLWVCGEIRPITVESEVDIVAYKIDDKAKIDDNAPKRIIAVYSCKVSLRERFQQDLFWADRLRGRGIRFCLITLDNDGVLTKAATNTKAATKGVLTSKQASMSVAAYDRIYLFCNKSEIQIEYCTRVFRTVDCLGEDLKRWLELD
jgi:hypothetical protein